MLMASLCLVACGSGPTGRDVNCATVLSYTEPVLTVTQVQDADGDPVPEVVVTRYRHDGVPSLRELRWSIKSGTSWSPTQRAATSESGLHAGLSLGPQGNVTCTVPCAFGSDPGTVELVVVTGDQQRSSRSIEVGYESQLPGCGGAYTDGTDVRLVLTRSS